MLITIYFPTAIFLASQEDNDKVSAESNYICDNVNSISFSINVVKKFPAL